MAAKPGSRQWIGETLRQLRQAADPPLPGTGAAKAIGVSQSRISRIEGGKQIPTPDEIRALCRLYKAPAATRREMLAAEQALRSETVPARAVITTGSGWKMQLRIRRVENASSEIWNYQPAMISGLLQTEEYMGVVWNAGGGLDEDGRKFIEERIKRQRDLERGSADAVILMTEGSLRWQGGSAEIMAGQLARLLRVMDTLPNVRIGVVPQYRPADFFTTHGYSVYDQSTVILGVQTGTSFISDEDQVATYVKLFRDLERVAVYGAEARAVIERIAAEYRVTWRNPA